MTGRPAKALGLLALPETPPPELTEAIQHGIFEYGIIPAALYGALAGIMWLNLWRHPEGLSHGEEEAGSPPVRTPDEDAR